MLLALRYYGRQMARLRRFTVPAMLLPALGNTCTYYVAPLIVAQLVGRLVGRGSVGTGGAMPYVLGFAGVLLFAEILWRIGIHCLNRLDGRGIENLYVIGMDELLAKDAAFFHDNFAGSLTKRVLSFASRFEDFTDNLVFNIVGSLVPLVFASVVLWRYDPLLVAGLIGLIAITGAGIAPLIRRRQRLVDQREEAIARVSGHVADSLMNMDTIRAFAAGDREAAEHRSRVADQRRKSVRSWDYANLRIDTLVAPVSVLTNVFGLLLAVALGGGKHGIEAIIVAFTYYSNATRIMFEFNQIYRSLESSLTEAAQFTELLLTQPAVVDPIAPEPLQPKASDVRFEHVTFAHAGGATAIHRPRPGCAERDHARSGRPVRRWQDHADPSSAADDGCQGGPDPDRRPGHQQAAPVRPAQPDRLRGSGSCVVPPDAARQHRVRAPARDRRGDPPGGAGGACDRVR